MKMSGGHADEQSLEILHKESTTRFIDDKISPQYAD